MTVSCIILSSWAGAPCYPLGYWLLWCSLGARFWEKQSFWRAWYGGFSLQSPFWAGWNCFTAIRGCAGCSCGGMTSAFCIGRFASATFWASLPSPSCSSESTGGLGNLYVIWKKAVSALRRSIWLKWLPCRLRRGCFAPES